MGQTSRGARKTARRLRLRHGVFAVVALVVLCRAAVASAYQQRQAQAAPAFQAVAQADSPAKKPSFDEEEPAPQSKPAEQAKPSRPSFDLEDEPETPATKSTTTSKQGEQAQPSRPGVPSFDLEDEPEKPATKPVTASAYAGIGECIGCHDKQAKTYLAGPHGRRWDARTPAAGIGCERCHGPGLAHDVEPGAPGKIVAFKNSPPREVTRLCLTCHEGTEHAEWQSGMHAARNLSCVNCHSIHSAKSERGYLKEANVVATCAPCHRDKAAKLQRASHMPVREGKIDCTSCHNQHGSTNVRMLRTGNTVNELCTSCHAEKRGPFLWEHPPVRENCATCHDPHGSSNDRLLVAKAPMLCQRCHVHVGHPATPYDNVSLVGGRQQIVGRGCPTCHSALHGSNHPSGIYLHR